MQKVAQERNVKVYVRNVVLPEQILDLRKVRTLSKISNRKCIDCMW